MAVKSGYKRLKEFDYLTELSEEARAALDIPADASVVNITDRFREGGPIVISYSRQTSDAERRENRRRLQYAIDSALDDITLRCRENPTYIETVNHTISEVQKKYCCENAAVTT